MFNTGFSNTHTHTYGFSMAYTRTHTGLVQVYIHEFTDNGPNADGHLRAGSFLTRQISNLLPFVTVQRLCAVTVRGPHVYVCVSVFVTSEPSTLAFRISQPQKFEAKSALCRQYGPLVNMGKLIVVGWHQCQLYLPFQYTVLKI